MDVVVAAAQASSVAGDVEANVARHVRLARSAAERSARLVIFPELSLTGYELSLARACRLSPEDVRLEPLRSVAQDQGITLVAGAPLALGERLYLAAFVFQPDGSCRAHTKVHLHPGEEAVFAPGTGGPLLGVGGVPVALAICADFAHPEHAARAASAGAQLYAVGALITAQGFAADAEMLMERARGQRMAVLLANHGRPSGGYDAAGRSAFWKEDGTLGAMAPRSGEALVVATRRGAAWEATATDRSLVR